MKPSSGMTGEDCSQPPDGIAAIMLPKRSTASICTVSPRRAERMEASVGSPPDTLRSVVESSRRALQGALHLRLVALDAAGAQLERGLVGDELAALVVIGIGQQRLDRHVDEIGIAVIGLAVGEGELHGLDDGVDELARSSAPWRQGRSPSAAPASAGRPAPGPRAGSCSRGSHGSRRSAARRSLPTTSPCRRAVSTPRWREPLWSMASVLRTKRVDRLGDEALVEGVARRLRSAPRGRGPWPRASRMMRFQVSASCGLRKSWRGFGTSPPGRNTAAEVGHSVSKNSFRPLMVSATRGSSGMALLGIVDRRLQHVSQRAWSRDRAAAASRHRTRRARRWRAGRCRE